MKVSELIEILKKQPQDLEVAYKIYSEYCLLKESDLKVVQLCEPRHDGWIARKRPDRPTQNYLLFPGN